jgi:serine/threonine protein kinase
MLPMRCHLPSLLAQKLSIGLSRLSNNMPLNEVIRAERAGSPLLLVNTDYRKLLVIQQLLAALRYLHKGGYAHNDVHPGNVIVGGSEQEPEALLVDFGQATRTRPTSAAAAMQPKPQTLPLYAPPELLHGVSADEQRDVLSCALTVIELLSTVPPFGDSSATLEVREPLRLHSTLEGQQRSEPSLRGCLA